MDKKSEIERRVDEVHADVREIKQFLIGGNGNDGVFTRLTKTEQKQSFSSVVQAWLVAGFLGLSGGVVWIATLVLSLFRDQK